MRFKKIFVTTLLSFCLIFSACSKSPAKNTNNQSNNQTESNNVQVKKAEKSQALAKEYTSENYKSKYECKKPIITIKMEDGSIIKAELYPDIAPRTVDNFVSLVQEKFYDGLIFHRVVPGFVIQGGDPLGNGTGDPGYSIPGEFTSNGFKNNLKHVRGVLSMARAQDPNSAGSQFFIVTKDSDFLDGEYAAFGKVIEGLDVVDKIVNVKAVNEKPVENQVMKEVTVEIK